MNVRRFLENVAPATQPRTLAPDNSQEAARAVHKNPVSKAADEPDESAPVAALAELVDTPGQACARPMLAAPGTPAAEDALRLLVVRAWLLSLGDDLARLRGALVAVDIEGVNDHAAGMLPKVGVRG